MFITLRIRGCIEHQGSRCTCTSSSHRDHALAACSCPLMICSSCCRPGPESGCEDCLTRSSSRASTSDEPAEGPGADARTSVSGSAGLLPAHVPSPSSGRQVTWVANTRAEKCLACALPAADASPTLYGVTGELKMPALYMAICIPTAAVTNKLQAYQPGITTSKQQWLVGCRGSTMLLHACPTGGRKLKLSGQQRLMDPQTSKPSEQIDDCADPLLR